MKKFLKLDDLGQRKMSYQDVLNELQRNHCFIRVFGEADVGARNKLWADFDCCETKTMMLAPYMKPESIEKAKMYRKAIRMIISNKKKKEVVENILFDWGVLLQEEYARNGLLLEKRTGAHI